MLQQTVIQIGNSVGITFPSAYAKKVGLKPGKKVYVEHDAKAKVTKIHITSREPHPSLTPEFKTWLDNYVKENEDLIKELAKA